MSDTRTCATCGGTGLDHDMDYSGETFEYLKEGIIKLKATGEEIYLTRNENIVFRALLHNMGRYKTREDLLTYLWMTKSKPHTRIVDVYIGYLRKKLGNDSIVSQYYMGYKLNMK
jgi:DNA-binding response OmpR family regulator